MDRFAEITAYVKVAQLRSFAGAASALSLSPAMVSRHIKALETRLGVELLSRTTRRVAVTGAGKAYLDRCVTILGEVAAADGMVNELQSGNKGTLVVTAPQILGSHYLMPIILGHAHMFPDVRFDVRLEDRRLQLLEDGIDVALRVGRLEDSSLICRRISTMRRVICAAPAYLAKSGRPERFEELAAHRFISYGNLPMEEEWRVLGQGRVSPPEWTLRANHADAVRQAAVEGVGLCCLPRWVIAADLREGRLVQVLEHVQLPQYGIFLIFARRQISQRVRIFVDLVAPTLRASLERDG